MLLDITAALWKAAACLPVGDLLAAPGQPPSDDLHAIEIGDAKLDLGAGRDAIPSISGLLREAVGAAGAGEGAGGAGEGGREPCPLQLRSLSLPRVAAIMDSLAVLEVRWLGLALWAV